MAGMSWADRAAAAAGNETGYSGAPQIVKARATGVRNRSDPAAAARERRETQDRGPAQRSPYELLSDAPAHRNSPATPTLPAKTKSTAKTPPRQTLPAVPDTPASDALISPITKETISGDVHAEDTTNDGWGGISPIPIDDDDEPTAEAGREGAVSTPPVVPPRAHPTIKPKKKKKKRPNNPLSGTPEKGEGSPSDASERLPGNVSPEGLEKCGSTGSGSFMDVTTLLKEGGVLPTCLTRESLRDEEDDVYAVSPRRKDAPPLPLDLDQFLLPISLAGPEDVVVFDVPTAHRVCGDGLSHWVYHITLSSRMEMYRGQPHFECQQSEGFYEMDGDCVVYCEKRYSDLEWLYGLLKGMYPSVPIPPIPYKSASATMEKVFDYFVHDSTSNGVTDDPHRAPLVQDRIQGIALFLSYLGGSPLFSTSELVHHFMLKTGAELAEWKADIDDKISQGLLYGELAQSGETAEGWGSALFSNLKGIGDRIRGKPDVSNRVPTHIQQNQVKVACLLEELNGMGRALDSYMKAEEAHSAAVTATLSNSFLSNPLGASKPDAGTSPASVALLGGVLGSMGLGGLIGEPTGSPSDANVDGDAKGGRSGSPPPPGTKPKLPLQIQLGGRVVDSAGNRGTIRWAGQLAKSPRPEMTYVGVWTEWGAFFPPKKKFPPFFFVSEACS